MKISKETLQILQNYAGISDMLSVRPGSRIKTIAVNKGLLADAVVDETFPVPFHIYDLSQFLNTISLFENPDLVFGEKEVEIREGKTRLRYVYASEKTILSPPTKEIECRPDVVFVVSKDDLIKLTKAANILSVPDFTVTKSKENPTEKLIVTASDSDSKESSNQFHIEVDATKIPEGDFSATVSFENLKLIPDDYTVTISSDGIFRFASKVTYYTPMDKNRSKFDTNNS